MSTAIARNLMAEMKLGGMLAAFDKTVTDATRDQLGYSEFLDVLLQAEADYRGERVAQRRPSVVWRWVGRVVAREREGARRAPSCLSSLSSRQRRRGVSREGCSTRRPVTNLCSTLAISVW